MKKHCTMRVAKDAKQVDVLRVVDQAAQTIVDAVMADWREFPGRALRLVVSDEGLVAVAVQPAGHPGMAPADTTGLAP